MRAGRRQRRPAPVAQQALHAGRELERPGGPHRQRQALLELGATVVHRLERRLDVADLDLGEEAHPPDVDAEHRAVRGVRHPHAAQEGAVAAEGHEQVEVPGALRLVLGAAPRRVVVPDVDVRPGDVVGLAPAPHHRRRPDGGRPAPVHDDADPVQRAVLVAHPASSRNPTTTTTTAATSATPAPANTACSSPTTEASVARSYAGHDLGDDGHSVNGVPMPA